ncbi:MAG: 4-hydroxy-tetrahydrodipicolinate synthase [Candidatus Edwardsbacteria bacterium]
MFHGSFVALITPFKNDRIDEETLRKLIDFHLINKTSGIISCATTGESPTIEPEEWKRILEIIVNKTKGKMKVIAYTGTNNTKKTVEKTKEAKSIGADACLIVTPYYNKPTQEGLYQHFKTIAKTVNIPILIYNVPSRTGVSIEPKTIARLAEMKNIVGIKEASGNLDQVTQIAQLCGEKFSVLSGDDSLTLPMLSVGAKGVISVVANIAPKETAEMIEFFENGNLEKAKEIHHRLFPLVKALFLETNPIPVKAACELMRLCSGELRLPLVKMSEKNLEILKTEMEKFGLI